ncbi:MAG TPA: hypothetical protein VFF69_07115 [Phycisphaerales bacterium]|nr:hypothetical protein [Phycisphaerales bacterium]
MTYPIGYGEAEHRRALDALLTDLAMHGQAPAKPHTAPKSLPPAGPPAARVLGATSVSGHYRIELRLHPAIGSPG